VLVSPLYHKPSVKNIVCEQAVSPLYYKPSVNCFLTKSLVGELAQTSTKNMLAVAAPCVSAFAVAPHLVGGTAAVRVSRFPRDASMNLFGDLFDDSRLKPQKPPERPFLPALVRSDAASYVLRESMFSFSGEDFRVRDIHGERRSG